jgi:hypothetical protein
MTGRAVRYEPPRRPWHPVRAVRVAALPQAGAAGYLMCAPHWYRLPAGLRARIWATYRPGQTAATASPEYLDALREALGYAAAREVAR